MTTQPRHFIDLPDIDPQVIKGIVQNAHRLKAKKFCPPQLFSGLSLAMVFDKRSTRTRMSFEVAMKQLGGHTIPMTMAEMQITGSESVEDTANVLSRYVDAVMIRMSDHETLLNLAEHASIPVINGLTDHSHPCQIIADIVTIEEKRGDIQGKKIAWFGDYNNVARTFEHAGKIFDFELTLAVPEEQHANALPPEDAAKDADVIVTDTWVSMGEEGKGTEKFAPFKVTMDTMAHAKDDALFMHCMPIHRGYEVCDDVLQSEHCVIYDEAENRLHAQKAILAWCLGESGVKIQQHSFDL